MIRRARIAASSWAGVGLVILAELGRRARTLGA